MRGMLGMLAVWLGVASVAGSFASVIRNNNAALAHALAPWDGRISAQLAMERLLDSQVKSAASADKGLARHALSQDATAVLAVTTLGLQAQQEGSTAQARRLFAYGQHLTRRDLQTQLWAIEDSVARGEIAETLRHYDIALRTSKRASEVLFPILLEAVEDPRIRRNLIARFEAAPPWAGLFIEYAAANGTNPAATALLFRDFELRRLPVADVAKELLLSRLAAKGLFDEAWGYYASFRTGARRQTSRDPKFSADLANPTLFDWQSVATDGMSASIQPGMLDVSAPPSVGGRLATQAQMLPAGNYKLIGHFTQVNSAEDARPYWVLTCQDGREIGRVPVPNSTGGGRDFSGFINVPANCPAQTLTLMARAFDAMPGMSGQFDRVQLVPASRGRGGG